MLAEAEIPNVEEYLNFIKGFKTKGSEDSILEDFLFRGQSDDHPLTPKICRLASKGNLLNIEKYYCRNLNGPIHCF